MKCLVGRNLSYSPSWSPNWKAAVSCGNYPVPCLSLITAHTSYAHHQRAPSSYIQTTTKRGRQTILHPKGPTSDKTDGFGKGRVSAQEKQKTELSDVTTGKTFLILLETLIR